MQNNSVGYKKKGGDIVKYFSLLFFCFYVIALNIGLTQYIANKLDYHVSLGVPLWKNIYAPWKWIEWFNLYYDIYKNLFIGVWVIAVIGITAGVTMMFGGYVYTKRTKGNKSLHGTAHFATKKEVLESGLQNQKKGVYVGGYGNDYLRHAGDEHVFVFAPTRSGKGVGLILPTLLSWKESVLILDIKGENWALTSGWRKEHANNHVLRFEPTCNDGTATRFNPFAEIRIGTDYEISDTTNILNIVAAPENPNAKPDAHFDPIAKVVLAGFTLHFAHEYKKIGKEFSLPELVKVISERPTTEIFEEMKELNNSAFCFQVAVENLERLENSPKEAGSIVSTARKFIAIYRDPIIAKNIHTSDFKIRDLMNTEKPVSLYLVIPPKDIRRLAPLTKVVIEMIINKLADGMEFDEGRSKKNYKHKLLLMLDEFPAIGKLKNLETALGYLAGYGIKAYFICQDVTQIQKVYTREESITSGCHVQIAYPPNKIETAEYISKKLGKTTVVKKKITTSGKRNSLFNNRMSLSIDEISRPLLNPDEVARLNGAVKDDKGNILEAGKILIFQTGKPPILGKQILYFNDKYFSARSKVSSPANADKIISKKRFSPQKVQDEI